MSEANWTDRQKREAEFYRRFIDRQRDPSHPGDLTPVDFAPVQGRESRPWNPYWTVYEHARRRFVSPRQKALDFGCGAGVAALRLAHLGYQVFGFDICDANIDAANALAKRHHLRERCQFDVMPAEQLNYPDHTFDLILGIDVLHHVDIPRAISEAYRVLRPGGIAVFKEHIEAPLIEPIRNSPLLRKLAPKDASLEHQITEDERKLTVADLERIHAQFGRVEVQRFTLLGRLDRFLTHGRDQLRGRIQQLDRRLMQVCPPLQRLAGTVVLTCHKASTSATSASTTRRAA
jgi:2-polyprenyl-3-methyl-5-hydroxy-6-metoxy-1,4-benzoquinol methylase